MLKLYDYLEEMIEEHNNLQWFLDSKLHYFASEIMSTLDIEDNEEMSASINRAFQACKILHIPINRNFRKIFRYDGNNLMVDWKLSPFACYLIIINCSPEHENVAKAQLFFAMNQSDHK